MKINFDEKTHTYTDEKGNVIPSATQIVMWKFPELYGGIPESILKRASEHGNTVHELCEKYANEKIDYDDLSKYDESIQHSVIDFKLLLKKYCMYPTSMEQIISYKNKYCGKYDLLCDDVLIDIKTTSKIHVDNDTLQAPLNLQLSLYAKALGIKEAWYLWLPKKGTSKMGKVELWSDEQLNELLKEYEKDNEPIYTTGR